VEAQTWFGEVVDLYSAMGMEFWLPETRRPAEEAEAG
jgi:hypothetical protein